MAEAQIQQDGLHRLGSQIWWSWRDVYRTGRLEQEEGKYDVPASFFVIGQGMVAPTS